MRVVRGPYLQSLSSHSLIVKWRTSEPGISKISYGLEMSNLSQTVVDITPKINHELKIDNLDPSTKYFYQIEDGIQVLVAPAADLFFVTAPLIGSRVPLTAWILGDCGTANTNARSVRDAYHAYKQGADTDLILFLGDNAYNTGTDNEYQFALFENMYENTLKNTVSWSCLGNHDGGSASSGTQTGPYYDIFTFPTQGECGGMASGTEAYYSFDFGNIHFIVLDSYDSDRSTNGNMRMWCEQDLQNTAADWIVAFWHHPAYSKGSHDSDTESALVQMRQNFLPLLESHGVDLVLSGHSHSYERSYFLNGHYGDSDSFNSSSHTIGTYGYGDGRPDGAGAYVKALSQDEGAVYITAGSSGQKSAGLLDHEAMYLSVSELGSCALEVFGNRLVVKFIRETAIAQDSFTIEKDLSCTLNAPCDDGNICTNNDQLNADCQCVGTPISNVPVNLVLDQSASPLRSTYKATQSILVSGNVSLSPTQLTTLIAPEVLLQPTLSISAQTTFVVMQSGCN
ncbi:MAG: metallophosphoesterase family protein [Saprospiraceae bacterium]|nr:metallophosphoesterase family protein [Saprospiraceae bacterium]